MNAINYEKIKYHIEYGKVKNLYIHIKNGEVIVKAPRFITKKYIDKIVEPNKIRIRNIKYAWGSCSSNKNITINLKLVNKSEEEIKYVALHELCHLKYMNHSDKFWNLVEKYMPNYKEIRKQLKNNR